MTLALHMTSTDLPFVKWLPLVGAIVIVNLTCYASDKRVLGHRWTGSDTLRLTIWSTVSPSVALLFVAVAFDAIYDKKLVGMIWLGAAALCLVVGGGLLRLAQGMKLRRVKSGELHKRAFILARCMAVPLKTVYVVPAGRGHLTNGFGGSQSIALTDNYGNFLRGRQFDFVIGHELAHVKERHGWKNRMIAAAVYACAAVACFTLPVISLRYRPMVDVFLLIAPILVHNFFSRRFEYAADAASVAFTRDPEAAIRALANLYRVTQVPTSCDRFSELFLSHPALTRRASALGEHGQVPSERISEILQEARLREHQG